MIIWSVIAAGRKSGAFLSDPGRSGVAGGRRDSAAAIGAATAELIAAIVEFDADMD